MTTPEKKWHVVNVKATPTLQIEGFANNQHFKTFLGKNMWTHEVHVELLGTWVHVGDVPSSDNEKELLSNVAGLLYEKF